MGLLSSTYLMKSEESSRCVRGTLTKISFEASSKDDPSVITLVGFGAIVCKKLHEGFISRSSGVELFPGRSVKHPLFQKVPKEKQTAAPPVITRQSAILTVVVPISSGRTEAACLSITTGHAYIMGRTTSYTQISSVDFKIRSLIMPPTIYTLPW